MIGTGLLSLDCIILPKSQRRIWIVLGLVSCLCYQTWWKYIYSFKDIRYACCMHQSYCLSQQRELVRYYILFFHRVCILQMNHVSHSMSALYLVVTPEIFFRVFLKKHNCSQWQFQKFFPNVLLFSCLINFFCLL